MAQFREWLSGTVNAVHSRNSQALQERLDWNCSVANACAVRPPISAAQVERQAADTFRALNSGQAAKWAAFAAAHMLALIADKNGQLLVRSKALHDVPGPYTVPHRGSRAGQYHD